MKSRVLAITTFLTLCVGPAYSQGCAACRDNAAAAPAETQQSLKRGIVVLLIPSLGAMGGLMGLAYRERNRFNRESDD